MLSSCRVVALGARASVHACTDVLGWPCVACWCTHLVDVDEDVWEDSLKEGVHLGPRCNIHNLTRLRITTQGVREE